MRVLVLGAPGSGTSTQAGLLAGLLGLPVISADHVLRVHANGTPLGRRVRAHLAAGVGVPAADATAMVRERLSHRDARGGWVLTDFPWQVSQADELARWCADCGRTLDLAILIGVPEAELRRRARGGDRAGGQGENVPETLVGRYDAETAPLLEWLHDRGLLSVVDGRGTPSQVAKRCLAVAQGRARGWSLPA